MATELEKQLAEALRALIKRVRVGYDGLPQGQGIRAADEALAAFDAQQAAITPESGSAAASKASAITAQSGEQPAQGVREAFEAAYTLKLLTIKDAQRAFRRLSHTPDEYEVASVHAAWVMWQYARATLASQPAARVALTEAELQKQVSEYGPQSVDEEIGYRDGFRAAERAHGITAPAAQEKQG